MYKRQVKTLQEGFIHQTVGTKETDAECDLDYTIGAPKQKKLDYAMSNSLGFGGHNATTVSYTHLDVYKRQGSDCLPAAK